MTIPCERASSKWALLLFFERHLGFRCNKEIESKETNHDIPLDHQELTMFFIIALWIMIHHLLPGNALARTPLSVRADEPQQNGSETLSTTNLRAEPNCYSNFGEVLKMANTKDCIAASLRIPESAVQETFNTNKPRNSWTLPWWYSHETCNITVTISEGLRETASWDRIAQKTMGLIDLCSSGQYPIGRTGGSLTMGSGGLIRLRVEKAGLRKGRIIEEATPTA